MFYFSDMICGSLMVCFKVILGGLVYLFDFLKEFVKENIFLLIDKEGKIFCLEVFVILILELVLINLL